MATAANYVIDASRYEALLAECQRNVTRLTALRDEEVRRPIHERRRNLLIFLDRERAVHEYGVWLLTEIRNATAGELDDRQR